MQFWELVQFSCSKRKVIGGWGWDGEGRRKRGGERGEEGGG